MSVLKRPPKAAVQGTFAPEPPPPPTSSRLLFHEDWWLDAVAPGRVQEVVVRNGDKVVGRFAFVVARKAGLREMRMPPFTHLLGPMVDPGEGKDQSRFTKRLSIVRELLDQLPPFDHFKQAMPSDTPDGLAFQERGFRLSPQYTFRIDCRVEPQRIFEEMHFKTRQHIRRAGEKLTVTTVDDPDRFVAFYNANLEKNGERSFWDLTNFGRLFEAARTRDSAEILSANWEDGSPAAMTFLAWGHGVMYYLLSSRAAHTGDNGSVNLLIWTAIQHAHERGLVFDFDGVTSSGTARFLSSFGGKMDTRLIVRRSSRVYTALQMVKRRMLGSKASEADHFT
jgi:hypothetical protein